MKVGNFRSHCNLEMRKLSVAGSYISLLTISQYSIIYFAWLEAFIFVLLSDCGLNEHECFKHGRRTGLFLPDCAPLRGQTFAQHDQTSRNERGKGNTKAFPLNVMWTQTYVSEVSRAGSPGEKFKTSMILWRHIEQVKTSPFFLHLFFFIASGFWCMEI